MEVKKQKDGLTEKGILVRCLTSCQGENQTEAWCTNWVLKSKDKVSFQHHPLSESYGYQVQSLGVITVPKDS